LSNGEAAQALGLFKSTARERYLRALQRLKEILAASVSWPSLATLGRSRASSRWPCRRPPRSATASSSPAPTDQPGLRDQPGKTGSHELSRALPGRNRPSRRSVQFVIAPDKG
jgi:hypothetical protein